jgi:large subunit ribosomal protein L35
MPKMKTNKTAAKRFKITGTGKLMRLHTRRNHLMINKGPNRKRHLASEAEVTGGEALKIKRMLPHSF